MAIDIPFLNYGVDPTATDVEVKIRGANWWPVDEDQNAYAQKVAVIAIRASIRRFLRLTRFRVFICSGTSETRYFNRIDEGGYINLGEGLLELESLSIQGAPYILNETVFAEPQNARVNNEPYQKLLLWPASVGNSYYGNEGVPFYTARTLRPRSIEVTGKWGQFLSWPEDAFEAIVGRAAGLTLSSVNQESELASISEDEYSESYDLVGPIDQKTALQDWGRTFEQVAGSYAKRGPGPQTLSTAPQAGRRERSYLPLL